MAEKSSMYLATRLTCIETTSGLMTKNGLQAGYRQISKKKLIRTYVRACVRACVRAWSSNLPLNLIFDSHIYLLLNTIIRLLSIIYEKEIAISIRTIIPLKIPIKPKIAV